MGSSEEITCPECMGLKTDISGNKCENCEGFGVIMKGGFSNDDPEVATITKNEIDNIFDPK